MHFANDGIRARSNHASLSDDHQGGINAISRSLAMEYAGVCAVVEILLAVDTNA
jgi:hypothetical protein